MAELDRIEGFPPLAVQIMRRAVARLSEAVENVEDLVGCSPVDLQHT